MLLKTVQSRKINPKLLITHHFPLDRILEAYDTFGKAASRQALKVIIETERCFLAPDWIEVNALTGDTGIKRWDYWCRVWAAWRYHRTSSADGRA
jgi:hypothetical protein